MQPNTHLLSLRRQRAISHSWLFLCIIPFFERYKGSKVATDSPDGNFGAAADGFKRLVASASFGSITAWKFPFAICFARAFTLTFVLVIPVPPSSPYCPLRQDCLSLQRKQPVPSPIMPTLYHNNADTFQNNAAIIGDNGGIIAQGTRTKH